MMPNSEAPKTEPYGRAPLMATKKIVAENELKFEK